MMNFFQRILQFLRPTPSPEVVARQLRQPSGLLAQKVGNKMNESNAPLYDFALREMKIRDDEHILEIGFGNGRFFEKIFAEAENLQLAGLDFSKDMVQAARSNNSALVKSGDLELHLGSSDVMPFADASFDKIFCINVVYFWEKPADHLREIRRVLKPGGRFYAIIRSKETMLQLPFTPYGFTVYEAAEWTAILNNNGFPETEVVTLSEPPVDVMGVAMPFSSMCIAGW
jgi:SAM-dependent methyltransferase